MQLLYNLELVQVFVEQIEVIQFSKPLLQFEEEEVELINYLEEVKTEEVEEVLTFKFLAIFLGVWQPPDKDLEEVMVLIPITLEVLEEEGLEPNESTKFPIEVLMVEWDLLLLFLEYLLLMEEEEEEVEITQQVVEVLEVEELVRL